MRVLAVLGRGLVPPDTPVLRADDPGALGDGLFETLHVRRGRPWLLSAHLERLTVAADRTGLPLPALDRLAELVTTACDAWPADREGALRLVCTAGPDPDGPPTAYALVTSVGEAAQRARRDGVRVVTLALPVEATARPAAPWLLPGVKSLSYAVSTASLRWAHRRGADDALWVSADGYALEAPTANLVWLLDGVLYTVPAEDTGILPGTTVAHLCAHAGSLGLATAERLVRPGELVTADGVWLTSSVRGLVRVREIDGTPLADTGRTADLQRLLGHPVGDGSDPATS